MSVSLASDLVSICLLSASLVGWGFIWGFEFGTGQVRLRMRLLRFVHAIVKPLAAVMGVVFWRLEALRARLQTGIANEEAAQNGKANFPEWEASLPTIGAEMNRPTDTPLSKEEGR